MGRILSYEDNEINEWLNSDADDLGYQILNDQKIVSSIQVEEEIYENENECYENDSGPLHNEAFDCLKQL